MRKLFSLLFTIVFTGCSSPIDDKPITPDPEPVETKVELSIEELFFNADGGSKTIEVRSTHNWEVKTSGDWLTISPNKGSAGKHNISVWAKSNSEYDDRLGVVAAVIDGNIAQQSLSVMQTGINAIVISQKVFEIPSLENELNIEIKHSVNFDVIIPHDTTWITYSQTKAMQTSYIQFNITQNTTCKARSVQVKIKQIGGEIEETVIIQQKGIDNTENNPILNPVLAAMNSIELDSTTMLHITGLMTRADFNFIKAKMVSIKYLDLSGAKLLNDEIPANAFGTLGISNRIPILDSITLPKDVRVIRSGAFSTTRNGDNFGGVYKLPALSELSNLEAIEAGAFYTIDNNYLEKELLKLPKSLKSIGSNAFYNRRFEEELTIPDNVTYIGQQAFSSNYGNFSCTLKINSNIEYIGYKAFEGKTFTMNILDIPNNIIALGCKTGAFSGFRGLVGELTIPNTVSAISRSAFSNCSGLTGKLTIPNSVTTIGNNAFSYCSGITGELIIPNSVTTIENSAFAYCTGVTGELSIPNGVTTIGSGAFSNCSGITGELTIPNSVTAIGNSAFTNCSRITGELVIPSSVTSIGTLAFDGCNNVDHIRVSWLTPITYQSMMFPYNVSPRVTTTILA